MNIAEKLNELLENSEPNILGTRSATLVVGGDSYKAVYKIAGAHQSANSWGRVDYKMNGKKIARAKLENEDQRHG